MQTNMYNNSYIMFLLQLLLLAVIISSSNALSPPTTDEHGDYNGLDMIEVSDISSYCNKYEISPTCVHLI